MASNFSKKISGMSGCQQISIELGILSTPRKKRITYNVLLTTPENIPASFQMLIIIRNIAVRFLWSKNRL